MSVMCHTIELCHVSRNVTMTSDIDPLPCPYSLPPCTAAWEFNDY